jgi:hypothetical protein
MKTTTVTLLSFMFYIALVHIPVRAQAFMQCTRPYTFYFDYGWRRPSAIRLPLISGVRTFIQTAVPLERHSGFQRSIAGLPHIFTFKTARRRQLHN